VVVVVEVEGVGGGWLWHRSVGDATYGDVDGEMGVGTG
jgi:hypothetical protein